MFLLGLKDFRFVRWTKILFLVEPFVMGTRTCSFYYAISIYLDYTQYYKMLLEQCGLEHCRSCLSCIVIDIELADKSFFREFLIMANFEIFHAVLHKSENPQNKPFGAQETCTELCETANAWITVRLPTFFLEL